MVTAYICDGAHEAAWFQGTQAGETVDLTDEARRLTAAIRLDGGAAVLTGGALRSEDGSVRTFDAERATNNARAGLYRADVPGTGRLQAEPATVGVILLSSGAFRGAYYADAAVTPVTAVRLGAGSLHADVLGVGTFAATRLTAPGQSRVAPVPPGPLAAALPRRVVR